MNCFGTTFHAYKGDEPYIFISYSHKDFNLVYPILHELHEYGYHIWFDEGIEPANQWPDEIADALEKCAYFIVFISGNSAASKNVANEINFALDENKILLAVHLEETTLPAGLRLRIGSTQAILKYNMDNAFFHKKLTSALNKANLCVKEIKENQEQAIPAAPETIKVSRSYPSNILEIAQSDEYKLREIAKKKGWTLPE